MPSGSRSRVFKVLWLGGCFGPYGLIFEVFICILFRGVRGWCWNCLGQSGWGHVGSYVVLVLVHLGVRVWMLACCLISSNSDNVRCSGSDGYRVPYLIRSSHVLDLVVRDAREAEFCYASGMPFSNLCWL